MIILYTLSMTIAFMGLLGAYYKKFRFGISKYNPKTKLYTDNSAQIWGLIYFVGFSLIPGVMVWYEWGTTTNQQMIIIMYSLGTLIAFFLALVSRRKGNFKV